MQDARSPFDDPGTLAKAIAEATDDVIFAKDLAGRYRYANPATLAAVGRAREQVIGRTDLEFMADPQVARHLMASDRRVFDSGEVVEVEEPVALPDGTVRHWLSRKMPLRDGTGRIVGLLGVARDITQRKLAQAERDADRLRLRMGIQAW
jgi:PAS domain S-box-containing protein